jgi:hypothetical protein
MFKQKLSSFSVDHLFYCFIGFMTLLRLVTASQLELGVDEAHYVLYGRHLSLSYFDHPPLVGWIHLPFQFLPFSDLINARLPSILISLLTTFLIYQYLQTKKFKHTHLIAALAVLQTTPMFNALSMAMLPDTLLMPLTILIVWFTDKVIKSPNLLNWSALGLWLGLAALTKYNAILFVIALVVIFVLYRQLNQLLTRQFWLGVFISAICVLPVLLWNIQNDFSSFKYQADHILQLNSEILKNLATTFVGQLIVWGVGPFLVSLLIYCKFLRSQKMNSRFHIDLIFLTVFMLFFIYASVGKVLLPHWMLMFFILALPIAVALALENNTLKSLIRWGSLISLIITLLLLLEISFKIIPIQYTAKLYQGISGWKNVMETANKELLTLEKKEKMGIAVMNWTLGSRASLYNTSGQPLFVLDKRYDQFDIWNPNDPMGYDLIVVVEAEKKDEHMNLFNCAGVSYKNEYKTIIKGVPVNHFLYYYCEKFLGFR